MKTILFLTTMLMSQTALAQSSRFMWSGSPQMVAPKIEPAIAPVTTVAPGKPTVPNREPNAKPAGKPVVANAKDVKKVSSACAPSYDAAQALFKEVYGADVDLARMGQFAGSFKSFNSTNQFKKNGNALWLNLNIGGMINTDVPVCVRKSASGKSLTATIITSNAKEAGTNTPQAMITQMVASGDAPRSITLSVNRRGKELTFSGRGAQATAAIR